MRKYPFETIDTKDGAIVKFDRENVKKYLDYMITYWRNKRKIAQNEGDKEEELIAACYVDAYRSVKISLGLEKAEVTDEG